MTNKERMSQIGEVMDELVKLGFEKSYYGLFSYYPQPKTCMDRQRVIEVYFDTAFIATIKTDDGAEFNYYKIDWQDDLINRVKELINK